MESPSSDAHKTMHLSINKGQNGTWNLIWEPYEGFKSSTYNIYRGTSPTNLNFLYATSGSSTQYSDLDASNGNVYYQLEVISPNLVSPTSPIRISPNPVKDVLNIEMEGGSAFEIMSLTGQVVFKGDLKESTIVNAGSYKPGMYVVKVRVGNEFEFRARSPAACGGVSALTLFLAGIGDSSLLAARNFNSGRS